MTWLTNTGVSSGRIYWENTLSFFDVKGVTVPAAVSVFPRLYQVPRSWAQKPTRTSSTSTSWTAATTLRPGRSRSCSRRRCARRSGRSGRAIGQPGPLTAGLGLVEAHFCAWNMTCSDRRRNRGQKGFQPLFGTLKVPCGGERTDVQTPVGTSDVPREFHVNAATARADAGADAVDPRVGRWVGGRADAGRRRARSLLGRRRRGRRVDGSCRIELHGVENASEPRVVVGRFQP